MSQSKTERGKYVFTVKEYADGTPWIMLERSGQGLDVFGNGFIGLDLSEGTTLQQAKALAATLRRSVSTVHYTRFVQ